MLVMFREIEKAASNPNGLIEAACHFIMDKRC